MIEIIESRNFINGDVYAAKINGKLIELTDTFLGRDTYFAIGRKSNSTPEGDSIGSRNERWMVGVSTMSGCPVRCKFCATGAIKKWKPLTAEEIVEQVEYVVQKNNLQPEDAWEFKINYTRMGEPFLNEKEVRKAVEEIEKRYPGTHHYISTIGIIGSDFSWIEGDNMTLQFSIHSMDSERRRDLIPVKTMSLEEIGKVRVNTKRKITLNFSLVKPEDFDIGLIRRYFDPEYFFVKLSPINPNDIAISNGIENGVIPQTNTI